MTRITTGMVLFLAAATLAAGLYLWQDAGGPPEASRSSAPAPVGVVTAPVLAVGFPAEIQALGTTRALDAVEITSKSTNLIAAIRFDDGDRVEAGSVLVELENTEEQAQLAEAEARLLESTSQFERARALAASQTVSESQLEQLEATMKADMARLRAAKARLAETVITAPFSGTLGLRQVSVGSLVTPGDVITTLDDTSSMRLDLGVPETFLGMVQPEMRISARSVAYPDRDFTGTVTSLDSRIDPVSRMITARARVPNEHGLLKPGMFLTVRLIGPEQDALVIPEEALVPEGERQFVFLVTDGKARRILVEVGRRKPGRVEILDGLVLGDEVIIEGTQKVVDGAPVAVLPALAGGATGR